MSTQGKVVSQKMTAIRQKLWPEHSDEDFWFRKNGKGFNKGFTTIPRCMPIICSIMESLHKGERLTDAYLALWCRVHDEAIIKIDNPRELALEIGYTGQRAETTWKGRILGLIELGFIKAKPGPSGDYSYIIILNPYLVIQKLFLQGRVDEQRYNTLVARMEFIGAKDLDPDIAVVVTTPSIPPLPISSMPMSGSIQVPASAPVL